MKIISRKYEKKELERLLKSRKSELLCVYGRRRVGKTYLIEQTIGDNFAFRVTGIETATNRDHLIAFNERLKAHGDDIKTIPKNWFEAFARMEKILKKDTVRITENGKKVIFFDEFPWLARKGTDFLLAFEEFWNRCGTQNGDIIFILCGSATKWIVENIIKETGSLYRRVTERIFLEPFNLYETELFFKDREFDWSREQITEFQAVFGGLPFIMDLMNENESFRQNVDRLLLKKGALLKDEGSILLESTLKKNPVHIEILKTLAKHPYGMKRAECQKEVTNSPGSFTRAVDDLEECGYIRKSERKQEKGNPMYLQLTDPFLLFHCHFLANSKNKLTSYEELLSDNGAYKNWRGHAFEILCLQHIPQIKKALGITGVETSEFPWVKEGKNGCQIDLVIERADKVTNICELKYTDKPFVMTKDEDEAIIRRRDAYKEETGTKNAIRTILISANGVTGTAYTEHISEVLELDDLFEPV